MYPMRIVFISTREMIVFGPGGNRIHRSQKEKNHPPRRNQKDYTFIHRYSKNNSINK